MNDNEAHILRYGGGGDSSQSALLNFPQSGFRSVSFCCTPMELLSNDGNESVLTHATGFFWAKNGNPYLVTNWHVVSGRDFFTRKLLEDCYIPRQIRFYGLQFLMAGGSLGVERPAVTIGVNVEHVEEPPVIQGVPVDIWTMPLPPGIVFGRKDAAAVPGMSGDRLSCLLNENVGDQKIVTLAGDDCFVLGYPLGNYEGLRPPIWKRGGVATDTVIGVGGHPAFLVDAATTGGMSGAPVVRRVNHTVARDDKTGALVELASFDFLGVYAGRLQSKSMVRTNLAYAWYASLVDQVISFYESMTVKVL